MLSFTFVHLLPERLGLDLIHLESYDVVIVLVWHAITILWYNMFFVDV